MIRSQCIAHEHGVHERRPVAWRVGPCPVFTLVALVLFLSFVPQPLLGQVFDSREQNLVSGLRERSLYALAERQCQEVLGRKGLTPSDFASIAVERIRIQTSQARTAQKRDLHWTAVDEIAGEFEAKHSGNPKAVLVGLQQALAHITFANQLQQEVEAMIGDLEAKRKQGLEQLAASRRVLDRTRQLTMDTIKLQANQNLNSDMLSSEQLRVLKTNLEYQQAVVNLTSAQLADPTTKEGKLDRLDSLGRVPEQLGSVRNAVAKSKPLWWKTWIREATCRRMLGDLTPAQRILGSLDQRGRPKSVDSMLMRERIELAIAMNDPAEMQRIARNASQGRFDPETEIALIRLLVGLGKVESASRLGRMIAATHGAWWARRADLALLSKSGKTANASPAVDEAGARMLFEAAEKAERSGDLNAAAQGFQSVATTQFSTGDAAGGLATSVRAAMALEKQGKHKEAAGILLTPSKAHPKEKLAASIHLRGCWNLSKANDPQFVPESKWHIKKWPDSESANQSRFWVASKQIAKKEFKDAFETLLSSQSTSNQFSANVNLARYASRKLLSDAEDRKRTTRPIAQRLMQDWMRVYARCADEAKPLVVVAMTELAIGWQVEDTTDSLHMMTAVEVLPITKSNLEFQYLLAILEGPPKGKQRIEKTTTLPVDSRVVMQTFRLLSRINPDKQVFEIQLAIAENLLGRSSDEKLKKMLTFSKAKALAGIGKKQEATSILKKLAQADSGNQKVLVALAEISDGAEALKLWRSIAARSSAQSQVWFEAKYNVAKLLHDSGKSAEAEKMLKYIKAVPPGWEKSELKSEFEKLLRACSR